VAVAGDGAVVDNNEDCEECNVSLVLLLAVVDAAVATPADTVAAVDNDSVGDVVLVVDSGGGTVEAPMGNSAPTEAPTKIMADDDDSDEDVMSTKNTMRPVDDDDDDGALDVAVRQCPTPLLILILVVMVKVKEEEVR
jgi:hypothetical protein